MKFRSLKLKAEIMVGQVNNFKLLIYLVCITYQMEIWVGENKIEDTPTIQRDLV